MTSHARSGQARADSRAGEATAGRRRRSAAPADDATGEHTRTEAPFLRYDDDTGVERVRVLDLRRPMTIGRADAADLSLGWDPSVSSLHAEAYPLGEHWLIGDEGISRNGTFVNGERLRGRRRLHHGDV